MQFDYQKATQALNYLAKKEEGQIDKLKAMKLIWIAERYHLRNYGRLIINDKYFAMDKGPVASGVKDIAALKKEYLAANEYEYAAGYIKSDEKRFLIISAQEPDLDVFSDSEIETFDKVYNEFGQWDKYSLVEFSHKFPEWRKFEEALKNKNASRFEIDVDDFFKNPEENGQFFDEPDKKLAVAEEVFKENEKLSKMWD